MKLIFLPLLFFSQLLFAQKTISSANKNAVLASVEKTPAGIDKTQ